MGAINCLFTKAKNTPLFNLQIKFGNKQAVTYISTALLAEPMRSLRTA